jgi:hypothetical protein
MQRASASTPTTPTTPDGTRPSKRVKTEAAITPDARAFQEAAAAEEAKKNAFIERAAAEAGETKWVLSLSENKPATAAPALRIVEAGYGAIDSGAPIPESDDDDEEEEQSAGMAGRRSFGKFNKAVEVITTLPPRVRQTLTFLASTQSRPLILGIRTRLGRFLRLGLRGRRRPRRGRTPPQSRTQRGSSSTTRRTQNSTKGRRGQNKTNGRATTKQGYQSEQSRRNLQRRHQE